MPTKATHPRRRGRGTAALLTAVALLSSCGGGTEPEDRGFYRATITGSVNETVEGPAEFTSIAGNWIVGMLPPDLGDGWDIFLTGTGPRPPAGTILSLDSRNPATPMSPTEAIADVSRTRGNVFDFWIAISGQIHITTSSESRLAGTFELSAQPHLFDGPGPITVRGTFDAVPLGSRPGVRLPP